jgi:hypothetical protein
MIAQDLEIVKMSGLNRKLNRRLNSIIEWIDGSAADPAAAVVPASGAA